MKFNESTIERMLRGIAGIVWLALVFTSTVTGGLAIVLTILGALLLLTGIVGVCPLYLLLKINTNKN